MNDGLVTLVSKLLDEVLVEDPVDFGLLQVDEDATKKLIVLGMVEHFNELKRTSISISDFEVSVLTVICKLSLENFLLHLQLRSHGIQNGQQNWMEGDC